MKSHYPLLVQSADACTPALLRKQCLDGTHRNYGGFPEPQKGFAEPSHSISAAATLAALYCCDRSRYYRDNELLDRALLAAEHTLRHQHADGTIDLMTTNFHDSTAVGFTIWNVVPAYRVMVKLGRTGDREMLLQKRFLEFMSRGADGMKHGGFHTPNHRWVMASAMAMLSNDLDRTDLLSEIDLYLNEGVDCNEDGEYSERSAGIYNAVNNKGLLVLAEELGRPDLLTHVERNLLMMFTYLEPDDTVLTMNSRRQDMGERLYPLAYYENYLVAAHRMRNPHFASMADELLRMTNDYEHDASPLNRSHLPKPIALYLLDDAVRETELEKTPFDRQRYERFYRESAIVRIRTGRVCATILAGNDAFLKVQHGSLSLFCRFAASFFGHHGRFIPDSLAEIRGGYRLHYRSDRGYVRPLGRPEHATAGGRINTEHRTHTHMQVYDVTADIIPRADGVDLRLSTTGLEHLPLKLELVFPHLGYFDSDQAQFRAVRGQHVMLKHGHFVYADGADAIRVDGAFGGATAYHTDLRGSLPPDADAFTVYFTDFSPIERIVRIRGI